MNPHIAIVVYSPVYTPSAAHGGRNEKNQPYSMLECRRAMRSAGVPCGLA
jgi:hypothetical protein